MGATRGRILQTTPDGAALFHPIRGNAPLTAAGIPFRSLRTGELLFFDPWGARSRKKGDISSKPLVIAPTFFFHGTLGSGKTAAAIMYAARLRNMQAGITSDGRFANRTRIRIHDRKTKGDDELGGEGEYAPFGRYIGATVVDLNRQGHFNVFDPKMVRNYHDLIEIAVNVCENVLSVSPLPGYMPLAMQVGVWKMQKLARDATSPGVLEYIIRNLQEEDVNNYFTELDKNTFKGKEQLLEELALTTEQPEYVVVNDFKADAKILANALLQLKHGRYGGVFGDEHSLYDALSAEHTILNWIGVNDDAASMMDAVLMKYQTIAVASGDRSIIPHVEITDEAHNAMRRLMYLRFYVQLLKEARSLKTARFIFTQEDKDITMHGDDGSVIAKTAAGLRDAIGGHFFGGMKYSEALIDRLRGLGFSRQDALLTTVLEPGCFAFKPSLRRDTLLLQLIPGATEWSLIQSDAATESMVNRRPILSFEGMEERVARWSARSNGNHIETGEEESGDALADITADS